MRWFIVRRKKKKPAVAYLKHKEHARAIITARVHHYATQEGFVFGRIAIKNQKRCWGSCSTKQNLNFNYKLAFLPLELIDYIVVHELCHLRHFHHRAEFWAEVESIIPEYKERIQTLRTIERTHGSSVDKLVGLREG
jgi:predicted metal-dependent hydrolase